MNPFTSLNALHHGNGEIVTVDITLHVSNRVIGSWHVKRKDSSRPPAINAFHMHRELVRNFERCEAFISFRQDLQVSIKRQVGLAVLDAYVRASYVRKQYFPYHILSELDSYYPFGWLTSLWWDRDEEKFDWTEITGNQNESLRVIAGRRVDNLMLQPKP